MKAKPNQQNCIYLPPIDKCLVELLYYDRVSTGVYCTTPVTKRELVHDRQYFYLVKPSGFVFQSQSLSKPPRSVSKMVFLKF